MRVDAENQTNALMRRDLSVMKEYEERKIRPILFTDITANKNKFLNPKPDWTLFCVVEAMNSKLYKKDPKSISLSA